MGVLEWPPALPSSSLLLSTGPLHCKPASHSPSLAVVSVCGAMRLVKRGNISIQDRHFVASLHLSLRYPARLPPSAPSSPFRFKSTGGVEIAWMERGRERLLWGFKEWAELSSVPLCGRRRLQAEAVAASARHKDTPLTPIPARGEIWPGGNGEF